MEEVPDYIFNAIQRTGLIINNISIWQYFRLLKENYLYISEMYKDNLQTHSSVAQYLDNNQIKIASIYCFIKLLNCNCMRAVYECDSQHYVIIREFVSDEVFVAQGDHFIYTSESFLHKCHATNIVKAISVEALITTCIYVKLKEQVFVALPINKKELE